MAQPRKPIVTEQPPARKKIIVGDVPAESKIVSLKPKTKVSRWSFGFRFFNQIRYFQIGGVDNGWFISLIDRLKEISQMDRERFLKDFSQHSNIRYHIIDWKSKNVPIERQDLGWVDKDYLDNEEEYPMLQFHISKALGRLVGFWDEQNVFQVVLLDPMHNIQPSKYNDYHVDDTYNMSSEYSSILLDVSRVRNKIIEGAGCEVCSLIKQIPSKLNKGNFVFACLDDDYINKLNNAKLNLQEILELGLLSC